MKLSLTENSKKVWDYLMSLDANDNVTAEDIGDALGMTKKSVDGIITGGLQKKGYTVRVPAEVEVEDEEGNTIHKAVKFIKLTAEGKAYNHQAAIEADARAAVEAAKAKAAAE